MKRLTMFLLGLCAAAPAVYGQLHLPSFESNQEALAKSEVRRYTVLREALLRPASDLNIDVTYYKLDLTITTSPNYLRGVVTMNALGLVGNLTAVTLDLMNSMTIDSVRTGSIKLSFVQQPATVTITLDRSYANGELITIDIYYRGVPGSSGFGSFTFTSHGGTPWVYTLSEPYGAKDWWPCKDHPLDKADSVDIWVTVASTLKVGSNGRLVAVIDNGNGTKTHRWEERYPISTYLVSIAITNYAEFTNWFRYSSTDSMPVLNFVLPEHISDAQANLPRAVDMLSIYSNTFGLYPFINEKYGHSEFGWGGGMEHQTMTSLGGFDEGLVAHELAHMWFGDMITCANWSNIWMNEGFATYSTAIYYERMYSSSSYAGYMNGVMFDARFGTGSLYIHDTASVGTLFDWSLVYAKGASVLHMLRHVLGDSVFFRSLRAYAQDPSFRFGVATTEDFRQVCETESGTQLGYFFDEWVYGESYPRYTCTWKREPSVSGYDITLRLNQTSGAAPQPTFFSMPIDCRLASVGWDTTVVLFNSSNGQQFTLTTSHLPDTLQLDPHNWILCEATSISPDKAYLAVDTRTMALGGISIHTPSWDDTFVVTNLGVVPDSVYVSLDYGNVSPDSAITVAPTAFALAGGSSQQVTFTARPPLLAGDTYYNALILIDSRFGSGVTHFEKIVTLHIEGMLSTPDNSPELPKAFALEQNYPNPWNPSTVIRYALPRRAHVVLSVFNELGQQVAQLVNEEEEAGYREVRFDGSGLASGVYFCRMQASEFVQTRKLLLLH